MHTLKGLARFPQILTEADVLRFNAEMSSSPLPAAEEAPVAEPAAESVIPEPAADPELVAEIPPPASALSDTSADPADGSSGPEEPAVLSDEEMAAKLERENNKADLVAMAEAAGLDQSGNKSELAARLVAHYRAQ